MDKETQRAVARIDANVKKIFTILDRDTIDLAGIKVKVEYHSKIANGILGSLFTVVVYGVINKIFF